MENRYDKYKDSGIAWIGEIPEHWEIRKLKNIFLLSTGTTPKDFDKISEEDNLINWYTPADILDGCNDLFNSQRKLSEKVICENNISLFPIGTLLYVGIGASAGKVGYANENGYSNQQITGLIPLECYSRFYFYYLSVLKDKIRDNAFFTTLPIINNVYLGQELIPYPLPSEQQSVAAYLDQKCGKIDELITLQEEMITKLQSYKQSVITEAVTKGLDKNAPLKDSGIEWIGKIPEHWKIVCLKRLSKISTGNQDTQDSTPDGRYPFFVRSPKVERSNRYTFEGPSILMAGDGVGAGKVFHLADNKFACHQRVYCINQFSKINRIFLFYYLSSLFYNIIDSANSKSTVDSVRLPMLAEFPVCIPGDLEQQAIADYLDQKCGEIDKLISIKQQKIEKLKEYKKSLIFEYVTGKRKVC